MTTDESALEKLRCLSAGGAKKVIEQFLRKFTLNFFQFLSHVNF